ncbi:VOC family protein [Sporolactobacillus pectinivorans]|uniref:VOC family protein n=1 Tax=Sporolactobacillus pectinivorans TaxID=1591408 RepID=UPI000C269B8B|nr:VOC family protein [Sporolactobacillus pectinivorans]
MKLTHSCIITNRVNELCDFYKLVLQIQPQIFGKDYVEFPTDGGILSFFSFDAQEKYAAGTTKPAFNKSLELEFNVDNVEEEYERVKKLNVEIAKPLTTQEWSNRSFYFKDPDGN